MQSEVQCAETTVDDHLRNLIQLMKRGGRVSITDIPNDPTFLSSHFGGPTVQAMAEKLEAALSTDAEPVAFARVDDDGRLTMFSTNENAGNGMYPMYKMVPLYAAPPAPSVAVKDLEWQKVALGTLDWNWLEVETASTAFGAYSLQRHNTGHLRVMFGGKVVNFFEPEKHTDARAAAQADYEARIRSALSAQVQDVAVKEHAKVRERMIGDVKGLIEFLSESPDNIYHLDASKVSELRSALSKNAEPVNSRKVAELDGVPDALAYGKGIWRTCTGCHESNEGYPTGPFSDTLKCHLGGGCFECGGIGAVWDTTDYEDMGNFIALSAQVQDADEQRTETCQRCQGNGEIVTDWERYRHPHANDVGDEAVAECPDCDGIGNVSAQVQDVAEVSPVDYMRRHDAAIAAYEANTPNDYRYSALALRKAVDAAFAVAAAPEKQEG